MADPVDELSFAALVVRMGELIDQQEAAVRLVMVQRLNGAGPIALTNADHGGKELLIWNDDSATTIEAHVPSNAVMGTVHILRRYGIAPVKVIADAGAILRCARGGHNGPALRYSALTLRCVGNVDGASAEWMLDCDTAVFA